MCGCGWFIVGGVCIYMHCLLLHTHTHTQKKQKQTQNHPNTQHHPNHRLLTEHLHPTKSTINPLHRCHPDHLHLLQDELHHAVHAVEAAVTYRPGVVQAEESKVVRGKLEGLRNALEAMELL